MGLSRPQCTDPGLTGDYLDKPRKIVILMLMGFEVSLPFCTPNPSLGGCLGNLLEGAA